MAQHDYNIANQDGASFRADINDALAAVVSCNSGPTAPATPYAYQVWHDTAAGVLRQRNAANTAWVTLLSVLGAATPADVAAAQSARAWVNFNGTGTVAIRASFNVTSITDNGVGDYTVNFTTALSSANYAAVVSSGDNSTNSATARLSANTTYATGSFRFRAGTDGAFSDTVLNNVVIFN